MLFLSGRHNIWPVDLGAICSKKYMSQNGIHSSVDKQGIRNFLVLRTVSLFNSSNTNMLYDQAKGCFLRGRHNIWPVNLGDICSISLLALTTHILQCPDVHCGLFGEGTRLIVIEVFSSESALAQIASSSL